MYNQYGQIYPQYNMQYGNPYQAQQPQQSLIKVTGIDGAKAYQMPANSVVALFDSGEDVFYIKTTDGAGFPTIRTFRFEPVENPKLTDDYVTRTEFNQLKEMILNYGKQSVSTEQSIANDK